MEEGHRREVRIREKYENATLLALKIEEGATSQGMQVESKDTFSPGASRDQSPAASLI